MSKYEYLDIDKIYEQKIAEKSDINELLPIVFKYAQECDHITEFGTRCGNSTCAFLKARPSKLQAYDMFRYDQVDILSDSAKLWGIQFTFNLADVLQISIETTDLLFIDTVHNYDQLSSELRIHANSVRKYILLHDTETYGEIGDYAEPKYNSFDVKLVNGMGLNKAINEFVQANKNWIIKERITYCNGLVVLENIGQSGKVYKSEIAAEHLKPKVYDCFSFFNELDVLEIRLNELDKYVDYFVLVEMTVTHKGDPKPLYFEQNKKRFDKFLHKIIHIVVADYPQVNDPWIREHYQRNCIERGLNNCNNNDIIIISDVDEIPRGTKISEFKEHKIQHIAYFTWTDANDLEEWEIGYIRKFDPPLNMNHCQKELPQIDLGYSEENYINRYKEIKQQIALLDQEMEELKPNLVTLLEREGGKISDKILGFSGYLVSRKSYQYSSKVDSLKELLKQSQKQEEEEGIATVKSITTYPTFRFK
jgi:hypothetical protein